MALLRDLKVLEEAAGVPALREVMRDALIRAMFVRDERSLPTEVVRVLTRREDVLVRVRDELEARQVVRVANGQETTGSLGRPADEFHYYRQRLGVAKDQPWGVSTRPTVLQTYDWIVPPQGGILVDLSALTAVNVDGVNLSAELGAGARWKELYDRTAAVGMMPAVFPSVPLDTAVGDALVGDARFRSFGTSFPSAVYSIRGIAANGLRVNCGFEYVPNAATGYNLKDLAVQFGNEFLVPTAVWLQLRHRPPVLKNLAFGFEGPAKLAAALGKLTASGRPYAWVNLADDRGWKLAHGSDSPGPLSLEVGVGGTEALVAVREKALEAAMAGYTAKGEIPPVWDPKAGAYAERSVKLGRLLFLGELVLPVKHVADAVAAVHALGQSKGVRAGVFGNVMGNGQVYLSPYFEAAKERQRMYDLSRGLADALRGIPDAVLDSRLAHLWNEDPNFRRRVAIVQRVEAGLDGPNAIEPPAPLIEEPIALFPGGRA